MDPFRSLESEGRRELLGEFPDGVGEAGARLPIKLLCCVTNICYRMVRLVRVHGNRAEVKIDVYFELLADFEDKVFEGKGAPAAEVIFFDERILAFFDGAEDGVSDVIDRAEVAYLSPCGEVLFSVVHSGVENEWKEASSAIVRPGEREGSNNGEGSVELGRCCLKHGIPGSFAGPVRVKGFDRVVFGERAALLSIDQACADVDETGVMVEAAVHLKEPHCGFDVEMHQVEP